MNEYRIFMIEALTNMHVGSGATHFGVVDNLIQRHPVTRVPVIHSSGVKGSLRDYFKFKQKLNDDELTDLFGKDFDPEDDDKENKLVLYPGHLIFFEASMLTVPLRSNHNVFYYCTSIPVILDFFEQFNIFKRNNSEIEELEKWFRTLTIESADFLYFEGNEDLEIEDFTQRKKHDLEIPAKIAPLIKNYLKIDVNKLAIFKKDIFTRICESAMPVIARNKIDKNGISENLFYEEILPRKTLLYFVLGADSYLQKNGVAQKFFDEFTKQEIIYQFGANYSIGYGFSKISEINSGEVK